MTGVRADRILREYQFRRDAGTDAVLEAVRVAIFVEDAFGVLLTDADIDPAVLCDPAALRDFVQRDGSDNAAMS